MLWMSLVNLRLRRLFYKCDKSQLAWITMFTNGSKTDVSTFANTSEGRRAHDKRDLQAPTSHLGSFAKLALQLTGCAIQRRA